MVTANKMWTPFNTNQNVFGEGQGESIASLGPFAPGTGVSLHSEVSQTLGLHYHDSRPRIFLPTVTTVGATCIVLTTPLFSGHVSEHMVDQIECAPIIFLQSNVPPAYTVCHRSCVQTYGWPNWMCAHLFLQSNVPPAISFVAWFLTFQNNQLAGAWSIRAKLLPKWYK